MAFGTQLGFKTGTATSIGTSLSVATGTSFAVRVGDLLFVTVSEQVASGNGTCSACTDNLGNLYKTGLGGGQRGSGTIAVGSFYCISAKTGTITSFTITANGGTNNGCAVGVGIEGAFEAVVDKDPASITSDITSPYAVPLTGTLSHAIEVVVAWGGANYGTTWTATSPNIIVTNATTAALGMTAIGIQTTSVTTSIQPNFATTAGNPANAVLGVSTFAQEQISPFGVVRPHWDRPQIPVYPTSMRGWISPAAVAPAAAATVQPGAISYRSPRTAAYPTSMLGWISPAARAAVAAPTAQYDWPLPRRTDYRARGWVQDAIRAAAAVTTAPFAQYDWPLPRRPNYPTSMVGFIDYDSYFVLPQVPANQYDWPLPRASTPQSAGWITAAIQAAATPSTNNQPGAITYTPPRAAYYPLSMRGWISPSTGPSPAVNPFAQYDWPLPQQAARARAGWIQDAIRAAAAVTPPFAQYDWPLPRQARYQAAGWISDAVKIIGRPFAQYDWPPPKAAHYPTSLRGFTAPSLVVSVRMGFNAYDWPLPRAPHYPISLRGLIDYARFGPASFTMGFNQYSWPLPQRSPPLPQSWFNPGITVVPTPPVVTQLHYRQPFGFMGVFTIYDSGAGPPPPVTFYLLQEDGSSRIILENASGLLELEH